MSCPNGNCRASDAMQRELSNDEVALINDPWARDAVICGYCGCVYTHEPSGALLVRKSGRD